MQVPQEWPADAGRPARDQLAAGGMSCAKARSTFFPISCAGESRGQHQTHLPTQIKQVIAFQGLLKRSLWEPRSLALPSLFQP